MFKSVATGKVIKSDIRYLVTQIASFIALYVWSVIDSVLGLQSIFVLDFPTTIQSVSWSLAEFRHNKIVQSPHENYFNACRQHKEK